MHILKKLYVEIRLYSITIKKVKHKDEIYNIESVQNDNAMNQIFNNFCNINKIVINYPWI
jgi:hypothetical protein